MRELCSKLELHGPNVWVDSRNNLHIGNKLNAEIEQTIRMAKHAIVVLKPKTINLTRVRKEMLIAEDLAATQAN